MSNFVQTQATYEYMPNTGFRSLNDEINKVIGKERSILKNAPPIPPEQPLFNPTKPKFIKKFFGGRASNSINREMMYKINKQNLDLYQERYY